MADPKDKSDTTLRERAKTRPVEPTLYKVVLHNDDYTTMQFVLEVLESVFGKTPSEAFRIMMAVHLHGHGVCGTYTHEVAETKAADVHDQAQANGFPLRASLEEA